MNNNKIKVIKVNILGQDYFVRSAAKASYFKEISNYVNDKMNEIVDSGIDPNTQQLKITVLACMNITDEFLSYKKNNNDLISQIESKSSSIIEYIDENLSSEK